MPTHHQRADRLTYGSSFFRCRFAVRHDMLTGLSTSAMQQGEVVSTSLIVLEPDLDMHQHMSQTVGKIFTWVRHHLSGTSASSRERLEGAPPCLTTFSHFFSSASLFAKTGVVVVVKGMDGSMYNSERCEMVDHCCMDNKKIVCLGWESLRFGSFVRATSRRSREALL